MADIHKETAKEIFSIDDPSESDIRQAKAINFLRMYGMSDGHEIYKDLWPSTDNGDME